jgi:hypothetical protein
MMMSKSACPLYYPSNEVIAFPAFTARSAGFAARIHGPVFPCQEIKKGNLERGFLSLIPVSSIRN